MATSDIAAAQLDFKYAQSLAHLSTAHAGRQLALAQHHGKRYRGQVEASKARPALEGEPQSAGHELHCGRCSVLTVPGWSGNMQLGKLETRKPGRNRNSKDHTKAGQATKLLWTCHCGWQTIMPGPAHTSKERFKKRRITERVNQVEASLPVLSPAVEEATLQLQPPIETPSVERPPKVALPVRPCSPASVSPTLKVSEPASLLSAAPPEEVKTIPNCDSSSAPTSKLAKPISRLADTLDARASKQMMPRPAVSEKPIVSEKTRPKKKRGKREGLQAMLAAKKENESKQSDNGGLGLNSFLQGLKSA